VRANCARKLHGTLHVHELTIRRCKAYLVTKPLKIVASGSVTIDSRIELAPGASLTIVAKGPIVNRAPIAPAPLNAAGGTTAQAMVGCPPPPNIDEESSLGITVDDPMTAPSGGTAPNGEGCRGGSIDLGSSSTLVTGGSIEVDAMLRAGDGGPGGLIATRPGEPMPCYGEAIRRTLNGPPGPANVAFVNGGDGGAGGSVYLRTVSLVVGRVIANDARYIRAGDGGAGGSAGGPAPIGPVFAPNGPAGEGGGSIEVLTGNGGTGGSGKIIEHHFVRADQTFNVGIPGQGGGPGSAYVKAGDGGGSNCIGGAAKVGVGQPGQGGVGSTIARGAPAEATVQISGGNGNPGPATYQGFGGSNGYVAQVYGRESFTSEPYAPTVEFDGFGDAGEGANGCAIPTIGPGGPGGKGASVWTYGRLIVAHNSFNGGNGGNGVGVGGAGAPGAADSRALSYASFMPGHPGSGCPQSMRTAIGGLSDGSGSLLAYSIQTNESANAFELILPTGVNVSGVSFPSGFSAAHCSASANVEKCTNGTVQPNTPLTGSFNHTGTILAYCECIGSRSPMTTASPGHRTRHRSSRGLQRTRRPDKRLAPHDRPPSAIGNPKETPCPLVI
jgi:hypothetical protein